MFKSFQEYLDQNKKLVEKPKVAKVADFEGKQPTKPEKEKVSKTDCGCHSGGKGQVGEVSPYSNGENAKDPNKDDKSGLVYKGDKGLVYEPDVDEKSKETKTWPKTGVAEWVNETKNLSLAEFARRIKEDDGDCSSGVHETSKALVEACQCNKKNIMTFVREAKRGKILEGLMKELFNISESYGILSKLIENEIYSSKFNKMFNEMVAEPVGLEDEEGHKGEPGEEGDMEGMGDEEGEEDMEDMGDEEEGEEDMEDMEDMGDEEETGDEEEHEDMEDMEDEEGSEDMEGEENYEDMEGEEAGLKNASNNPFIPKEATWHFKGINDAPESAKDRMLGMRSSGLEEEEPSDLLKVYSNLDHELKQAKKRVKDIEAKLIRFVQMRGIPTK